MTEQQIRDAILADAEMRGWIESGNDQAVADKINLTPAKIPSGEQLTERGLYKHLGATVAETILGKLAAYAATQGTYAAVVARVLSWMKPSEEGIDFQDAETQSLIGALALSEVITTEERDALYGLCLKDEIVTVKEVGIAARTWRPNGKIQAISE